MAECRRLLRARQCLPDHRSRSPNTTRSRPPTFKPGSHRFNDCQCPSTCSFLLYTGRVSIQYTPLAAQRPLSSILAKCPRCTSLLSKVNFLLLCLASILTDCLLYAYRSGERWLHILSKTQDRRGNIFINKTCGINLWRNILWEEIGIRNIRSDQWW